MSNLYSRITQRCEELGITGYRLCKDCGISPSVITDLGKGRKKTLSADYANKIAKRLNVTVDWLIGGETDEIKKDPSVMTDEEVDAELYEILTELKDRPEMRALFHAAKGTDADNVRRVADMLEGFKSK